MKLVSWNVNGLRSAIDKGLFEFVAREDPDIVFLQEIKISKDALRKIFFPPGYFCYSFPASRSGYSGVLALSKKEPVKVIFGIGTKEYDDEGRVMTLDYGPFVAINSYFPHARRDLSRIDFKIEFNRQIFNYLKSIKKPLILGGDFNVAHEEIDLANPQSNKKNPGFTDIERMSFDFYLREGLIDTFRLFNKDPGFYTWWSNFAKSRERNIGWRIDYFLISKELEKKTLKSDILPGVMGSDHAPIILEITD